jgi:hypothetical protein
MLQVRPAAPLCCGASYQWVLSANSPAPHLSHFHIALSHADRENSRALLIDAASHERHGFTSRSSLLRGGHDELHCNEVSGGFTHPAALETNGTTESTWRFARFTSIVDARDMQRSWI